MTLTPEQIERVQKQLAQQLFGDAESHAYAILDGASNPALLDYLYAEQQPEFACLYRGELEPDLAECAPYVVRLEIGTPFTDWLTTSGWGLHWGVFAVAKCDLKSMRYHLRRLTMVYEPETNKPLLFRFYDPRVMNVFLPTCDNKQAQEFFGPVQAWYAETSQGDQLQRFVRDDQQVIVDQL